MIDFVAISGIDFVDNVQKRARADELVQVDFESGLVELRQDQNGIDRVAADAEEVVRQFRLFVREEADHGTDG